jgi:hydrogenase nickel incorporation protein HypA/HybF
MHEMTIVTGILNIVEEQARAAGARVINSIEVEIGELAGVEVDALNFCFEAARKNTLASDADLIILHVEGLGHCLQCEKDVPVTYPVALCPGCGLPVFDVKQGRELRVKSINVD